MCGGACWLVVALTGLIVIPIFVGGCLTCGIIPLYSLIRPQYFKVNKDNEDQIRTSKVDSRAVMVNGDAGRQQTVS